MSEGMPMDNHGDRRPIPDPTTLTTEQLHREADSIRREMEANQRALGKEISGVERVLSLRIDNLERLTHESKETVGQLVRRFPLVVSYVMAVSAVALGLFILELVR